MEAVTLRDESIAQHGFYVPQFEIRIEGVGLPRDVLRDVTQVTYKDNIKEIDGFEITVNNWDADTRTVQVRRRRNRGRSRGQRRTTASAIACSSRATSRSRFAWGISATCA